MREKNDQIIICVNDSFEEADKTPEWTSPFSQSEPQTGWDVTGCKHVAPALLSLRKRLHKQTEASIVIA